VTGQSRRELFLLVDALCEGIATKTDRARLEQLVLEDAQARRLYLDAIELHGLLYWDAAGIGSAELSRPKPAAFHVPSRRLLLSLSGLVAALFAVIGLVWLQNATPARIAQQRSEQPIQAIESTPHAPQPAPFPPQRKIPEVNLPATSEHSGLAATMDAAASPTVVNPASPSPLLRRDDEVISFINSELRDGWKQQGQAPSPAATDAEWVRRVYLDLAGRIPTVAEAEQFLLENHPRKRRQLVDQLLAGEEFPRRLARVWTNLLVGRSRDSRFDRQALLSWMTHEFAAGRPWKETVTELVSARGTSQESGPANFLLAHLNNQAVPATAITSRILLCEQLQCSQCHQHPMVKEWGQERFWELNAFFQQTGVTESVVADPETGRRTRIRELVDAQSFGPTYYETLRGVMQVAFPKFADVELTSEPDAPLRERLAELIFSGEQPQPARAFVNRTWALLFGYGFTSPVDDMGPHNPVSHPELLDGLTVAFVQNGYDVRQLVRWICLSDAYQLSSRGTSANEADAPELGDRPLFSRMYLKPLACEQLFDSLLIASGVSPSELLGRPIDQRREDWLHQFYSSVDTEENGESSTFDGSLSQALMMMNGELTDRAVDPHHGQLLSSVAGQGGLSEAERIRQLSLAALSRYPSSEELARIRETLRRNIRRERELPPQLALAQGLRDIYWAYLNSSEFAVNH
jgi:hypothetical protein